MARTRSTPPRSTPNSVCSAKSFSIPAGTMTPTAQIGSSDKLAKASGTRRGSHCRVPGPASIRWSPTCSVSTPEMTKMASSSRLWTCRPGPGACAGILACPKATSPPVRSPPASTAHG